MIVEQGATMSTRPNRINIDLGSYKEPWLAHCAAHGTTPSAAFRLIVAKLLMGTTQTQAMPEPSTGKTVRKEIRLTASEAHMAQAQAYREGYSLPRWLVALVRARLSRTAQLGQHELELLAKSNMQLLAIGRNLNQLTRTQHARPDQTTASLLIIMTPLRAVIDQHTSQVAQLIAANTARWSGK